MFLGENLNSLLESGKEGGQKAEAKEIKARGLD